MKIRPGSIDDLPSIEKLWLALYEHQKANGMILDLPANAYEHWAASLGSVLGRFACLFIAEEEGKPIGFLAGRIRALPSHFGGYPTGFISDVYVMDSHRGHGAGKDLMTAATSWYEEQGVSRIELQVIANNEPARRFYSKLGWVEELVQMVWQKK